jgi:hypothetical protein
MDLKNNHEFFLLVQIWVSVHVLEIKFNISSSFLFFIYCPISRRLNLTSHLRPISPLQPNLNFYIKIFIFASMIFIVFWLLFVLCLLI